MATKGGREKIKLESTAGTGHFYTTDKNKKTTPEKMLIKKFDPVARKHVEYKEIKPNYFSLISLYSTCLRALGSNFMIDIFSGIVFLFLLVV